jgi:outer membrane immunogenic protein
MGTKFWGGVAVLASIVAGVGAAGAADLAVKAPVYKAPPPVILSDWAGFYIGINGGGGWGESKDQFGGSVKTSGGLFGGQAGYNWQYGNVVAGVEVDFDGADIDKTVTGVGASQKTKVDELASARARLGYTVLPNLLAYGTAGPGWGHIEVSQTFFPTVASDQFGWTAGAGLEYKIPGWDHVIARAEYLHYDFARDNLGVKTTVDTVRGGVSYKF